MAEKASSNPKKNAEAKAEDLAPEPAEAVDVLTDLKDA